MFDKKDIFILSILSLMEMCIFYACLQINTAGYWYGTLGYIIGLLHWQLWKIIKRKT